MDTIPRGPQSVQRGWRTRLYAKSHIGPEQAAIDFDRLAMVVNKQHGVLLDWHLTPYEVRTEHDSAVGGQIFETWSHHNFLLAVRFALPADSESEAQTSDIYLGQ